MASYTERDAAWDIIMWQIPAAFVFACAGVSREVLLGSFFTRGYPMLNYASFVVTFLLLCWASTTAILLVLDMLLLPPLFALIRLSYTWPIF